ncbi:MAG: nitrogen regulation protein NR(II) [Vicinamibacterales bacterium]
MAPPTSFDILQAVIEATPDAIFVKDLDGRYIVVNEAFARFLGRRPTEIIGLRDLELYPEETARRFLEDDREVLASGRARTFEGVATSSAGRQAYLVTKGTYRDREGHIRGIYGISHDITELKEARESLEHAREALFRAQKLEAVGQLTGGLAHDFNNILGVILGNVDLLKLHLQRAGSSDSGLRDVVEAILRAALHGKDLISQLLAFAGRRQLHPQPVDVDALVDSLLRMIERTIGPDIRIDRVAGRAGTALVDPAALEAALLNVAINARDAMPGGGTLTIRASRVEIAAPPVTEADPQPGTYALLSVEDTGTGMPPEVLARVFEPFFTTKGDRGGSGLGLSMVYGFARQSGGTVMIDSAPESGTTVSIFLPAARDDG